MTATAKVANLAMDCRRRPRQVGSLLAVLLRPGPMRNPNKTRPN
jgi:hypothetical protein